MELTSKVAGMRTNASVPPPLRRSIRGGVAIVRFLSLFLRVDSWPTKDLISVLILISFDNLF